MAQGKGTISREVLQSLSKGAIDLGRTVESLTSHNGWKVFLALCETKRREVLEKEDYATIEDFHADRRALKIIKETIAELESFVEDADSAIDLLKKFESKAVSQTPESILSVDGEEEVAAEG